MDLSEIIIEKIKQDGPISFHDFMEMALYHPSGGYYTSGHKQFGKGGDFYTSPELSAIFGEMIGKQMLEMWHTFGEPAFTIVEYGAGNGDLCNDILNYLNGHEDMYLKLQYFILEKSPALINSQQKRATHKIIKWVGDISEVGVFKGCVVSNEVLDNFSIHLVEMKDELMEVFVNHEDGFVEELRPASVSLKEYLSLQNIELSYGYRTEINLEAIEWLRNISLHLEQGYVLTIDYGYTAAEYYDASRNKGTIVSYHQHKVTENVYANAGRQDITAHVNFSALIFYGKQYGLSLNGYCNQNYFLRSLGLANYLREIEIKSTRDKDATFFQLNKLLIEMGNKFKVLILEKNMGNKPLMGMQFRNKLI